MKIQHILTATFACAFAFAASNTMPAPGFAGEGVTVTSGYTVSNVAYTLNGTTPSNIDSVKLDLDNSATTVKVRLVSTGSYYGCTVSGKDGRLYFYDPLWGECSNSIANPWGHTIIPGWSAINPQP